VFLQYNQLIVIDKIKFEEIECITLCMILSWTNT